MKRLRLAYFSPLPPARSGIADYSAELLPSLAEHVELTLFADEPEEVSPALRARYPTVATRDYPSRRMAFDLALYHVGNSLHHAQLLAMMRRYPGVMVLHDYWLHDLIGTLTAGQGDPLGYMREVGYERGLPGINQLRDMSLSAQGFVLPEGVEEAHVDLPALPLSQRLIALSLGVIVHSEFVRRLVLAGEVERPVEVIPMLVTPALGQSRRQSLPWPADSVIFASVGFINVEKQLPSALCAFAELRRECPEARYLIVGELLASLNLESLVEDLDLQDAVHFAGYAPDLDAFNDWLATADVLVNLRYPTRGETSASVIRALAAGRPVIVNDAGWYSELPSTVSLSVAAQDEEALLNAMRYLAHNASVRRQMGEAGQVFACEHFSPQRVAAQYAAFLAATLA